MIAPPRVQRCDSPARMTGPPAPFDLPMRLDSHQHFWHYDPVAYPWIGAGMDVLRADFGPAALRPLLSAHDFDGSIAVQARPHLAETRYLLDLARGDNGDGGIVRGVVGWVDLCAADVAEQLAEFANEPKLRGIRHLVQDEPDDEFLLRPDFARGLAALFAHGLTYDLLLLPRHLPHAVRLVERFPDRPFVLDHAGKPPLREGDLAAWRADLERLAAFPAVHCKVSGLVTEAVWNGWTRDTFAPVLEAVFSAFGPERAMFGSDWPVCLLAADYGDVYDIVDHFTRGFDARDRARLFGENAARFYGLSEETK